MLTPIVCLAFGSAASWVSVTIPQTGRRLCARTAGVTLGSPSGPGPHSSTHTTPTTHLGTSWPLLSIRTPLSYLFVAPNLHVFSQNKLVRKVFGLSLLEVKALGTGPDYPSRGPSTALPWHLQLGSRQTKLKGTWMPLYGEGWVG